MGIFSLLTTRYRMSQAAAIIQNLLELQARHGLLEGHPALLANQLVEKVWRYKPDIFNGTYGSRPHKLAIAAIALANGLTAFKSNPSLRRSLFISLAEVLKEVEINKSLYPFNNLDEQLIHTSLQEFFRENQELERESPLSSLMSY